MNTTAAPVSLLPSGYATLIPQEAIFLPMQADALADVMIVEKAAYPWPWSEGNMRDSIAAGHHCVTLRTPESLVGYFIAMPGHEEVHLLNFTVAPAHQRQGWAPIMLDALCAWAIHLQMPWVWLEVRRSNHRAASIYERFGFRQVGVRKGYYPLAGHQREDAIVMSMNLKSPA